MNLLKLLLIEKHLRSVNHEADPMLGSGDMSYSI